MTITEAKCTAATGKAISVEAPDLDVPHWIPHSQITDESEVWKVGDEGDMVVSDWFAEQRGWL